MDMFDSISNGIISTLTREIFARLFKFISENKEDIFSVFPKLFNKRIK